MLLTIDVGNTNTVLGVFAGDEVVEHWRIATDPVRTANPKEVGSDRIMNALAAVHLYGGPAIVVDFGTSTNFDAVSDKGEFVGGALAPGIEISVDALSRRAAQLLKVELTRPGRVIGKNTVEALQSGIIFGFAGQVEGIARRMAQELAPGDPDSV